VRSLLTTFAFLLPFRKVKIRLLNRLGHDIHPKTFIGICLVRNVRRFELAEGAQIGHFNLFDGLDTVRMGRGSRILLFNYFMSGITLEPGQDGGEFYRTLQMGQNSHIITFHVLDCSGGLVIDDDCWITGVRSTVLTHAFDPHDGGIIVEPVTLKKGSLVATSCTLLPGSVLGEGALLAAGSTAWTRQELAAESLHGGVPARRLSPLKVADWVYSFRRYPG
jgi:acetyltransferase-like isoleucine patch superfamily enzyme